MGQISYTAKNKQARDQLCDARFAIDDLEDNLEALLDYLKSQEALRPAYALAKDSAELAEKAKEALWIGGTAIYDALEDTRLVEREVDPA